MTTNESSTGARYRAFIAAKTTQARFGGVDPGPIAALPLFPHQSAIAAWALRKGRAAIFADTGLGKTRMQLAWAHTVQAATGGDVLILAPLAVADQTRAEGAAIGIPVHHARTDLIPGINVTNYERMHLFAGRQFAGVVLDESSRIKHHDSKTLADLMVQFADTPYRLCATATPAPNDWTELGTHAEFLGVCSRSEMLAEYFVHDGGDTSVWRLKGHARADFWRFVSGWGALVRSPADLGFDASAYDLPPLRTHQVDVDSDSDAADGMLFALEASTLSERRRAKRDSLVHRVRACSARVNATPGPWVIWTELNAEGDAITAAIPDAVEIRGSDAPDAKERNLIAFARGDIRVLVSKPSIAGWGLNWQHCHQIAFLGATDSFEGFYQAIRRCWRFGQTSPVDVYLYVGAMEGAVLRNLLAKGEAARAMSEALAQETAEAVRGELFGQQRVRNAYEPRAAVKIPSFLREAA